MKTIEPKIARPRVALKWVLSIMSLFLGPGCIGPHYVRPKSEVPSAYKESEGWKMAQPRDTLPRGAWWTMFGDTVLDSLEARVAIFSQTVAVARAQYRQALAAIGASRAGYFPAIGARGTATRAQGSAGLGASAISFGAPRTSSDFLLSGDVSWEPDLWGKARRLTEANKAEAQASAADLESAQLSVRAQLAQNYLQIRILDEQKRILDSSVTGYRKFLDLTMNRYASGVASRADVLQAQTQLASARAQTIDVGVQRGQLEHAIAMLIGKPASVFSIEPLPLLAVFPAIPRGLPSELLERRPDVAAAERRVMEANARIGAAEAAYFPTVSLTADGGFENGVLAKLFTVPSELWSLGASAVGTIFDGGQRGAQVDQARAVYEAAAAAYRQTTLTAFQEVEDNLSGLRILDEEARVQDEAVRAARASVVLAINQYKQGTVSALDVVTAQNIELNDRKIGVGILGNRLSATVLLIKAMGGGWDVSRLPFVKDGGGKPMEK